jgi:hypothetical protein
MQKIWRDPAALKSLFPAELQKVFSSASVPVPRNSDGAAVSNLTIQPTLEFTDTFTISYPPALFVS